MYLVALTGGIATGKSTVSSMFVSLGVPVIDADIIARRVVEPGKRACRRIRETFGDAVFFADGTLNRTALGNIIFKDPCKRQQLNQITHPEIFRGMCWEIIFNFIRGHKFVILDLPLLFESGMWVNYVKYVIVVSCLEDLQMQRLMDRNNLSEIEAVTRINAQMPLSEKISKAQFVIDNSGGIEETERQVHQIYEELNKSKEHLKIRFSALAIVALITVGISSLAKCLIYGNLF